MNYTVLFVIMSIVFLVAIGIIYTDIIAIREKLETIHRLDMKLIQKINGWRDALNGWRDALDGWKNTTDGWRCTIETSKDILEELKKVIERIE